MVNILTVRLIAKKSWIEFQKLLRHVTLMGDDKITPYQNAQITSRLVDFSQVYPISCYLLKEHIEIQKKLHQYFWKKYQIDTLNLDGENPNIRFKVEPEPGIWDMSPPIVEVSEIDGGKAILIDGEHRFMLAKDLGQKIRVIWIEGISSKYPTVASPVLWNDVKIYDHVPKLSLKRKFRFSKLSDFPDISSFSKAQVTNDNFHYFFYRNLNNICSSGVRIEGTS